MSFSDELKNIKNLNWLSWLKENEPDIYKDIKEEQQKQIENANKIFQPKTDF